MLLMCRDTKRAEMRKHPQAMKAVSRAVITTIYRFRSQDAIRPTKGVIRSTCVKSLIAKTTYLPEKRLTSDVEGNPKVETLFRLYVWKICLFLLFSSPSCL